MNEKWWDEKSLHFENIRQNDIMFRTLDQNRILDTTDFLHRVGLVNKNINVLDLGCGPGRYACSIAKYAKSVTGIDFSKEAINIAKKESKNIANVDFLKMNYMDVYDLPSKYELVMAVMSTPFFEDGILTKIHRICCGNCFVSVYTYRSDSLKTQLFREFLGCEADEYRDTDDFAGLFTLLLKNGFSPNVEYAHEEYIEYNKISREHAANWAQILFPNVDSAQNTDKVLKFLNSKAQNNIVSSKVNAQLGRMWWNVKRHGLSLR